MPVELLDKVSPGSSRGLLFGALHRCNGGGRLYRRAPWGTLRAELALFPGRVSKTSDKTYVCVRTRTPTSVN
jgi:hypothetical protein